MEAYAVNQAQPATPVTAPAASEQAPPARMSDLPFRALGGQPAFKPGAIDRFVAAPRIAVLSYLRADGRPCQSPIWYRVDGASFVMTTVTGSPKARALRRDPRVCLTIQDEAAPYRAVIADAVAELRPLPPGETDRESALRYFGRVGARAYAKQTDELYAASGLTEISVAPSELRGFDNLNALSAGERAFFRLRNHLPVPRRWL